MSDVGVSKVASKPANGYVRSMQRPSAEVAARSFIRERFPDAIAAFLGGSVVTGEATATSDLDVMVVVSREDAPFRESFIQFGWPIEAFVHTPVSYRDFFDRNVKRRRQSLPMLCARGLILADVDGAAQRIKGEATALMEAGPEPATEAELVELRYRVTDLLDDFLGSEVQAEIQWCAFELAQAAADLLLIANRRWLGRSKWVDRALVAYDPAVARQVSAAIRAAVCDGNRDPLAAWVDEVLRPLGGRLFAGFRR